MGTKQLGMGRVKISQLLILWLGMYIMFHSRYEFPYNLLNHDPLFSHFSFFLESIEILKLCVVKIITPL